MSVSLRNPIPIVIENGPEKYNGFIMKLTTHGLMVELDVIKFSVGQYLTVHFQFEDGATVSEKVRSVKHYDRFFRTNPQKQIKEGEAQPTPKKLCELHFHLLSESSRIAINKFLLQYQAQLKKGLK